LSDPMSLRLLLHVLEVGECDRGIGRQFDTTARAAEVRLDRMVAVGLMVRTDPVSRSHVYRVTNAASVGRLLATVRQLSTR
jgi:3-polyprenyl-4-hydroxybenzoate decarboxylase